MDVARNPGSACFCWITVSLQEGRLPPAYLHHLLYLAILRFQGCRLPPPNSFIHSREARWVSLATVSPLMPRTVSNKNKAGIGAGPGRAEQAAGLVAGLFWLAAHALHDPEDY